MEAGFPEFGQAPMGMGDDEAAVDAMVSADEGEAGLIGLGFSGLGFPFGESEMGFGDGDDVVDAWVTSMSGGSGPLLSVTELEFEFYQWGFRIIEAKKLEKVACGPRPPGISDQKQKLRKKGCELARKVIKVGREARKILAASQWPGRRPLNPADPK